MSNTDTEALVQKLRYMGRQYAAGQASRGGSPRKHYLEEAADTIERLTRENAALKTVMIAAAEEIHAHWQAHCDADGYGPQNLMRRLEEGIPSEYGYTAGAFAELKRERDEAVADALRFRWLCDHPDWHFVERLCREFVADSNMEFLIELRRVIDARRSVELDPFDEHLPPNAIRTTKAPT